MKCDLMKSGKCSCSTKCAKLIWYEQGKADERAGIIRIIEECVWRDADMLVELIKEQK